MIKSLKDARIVDALPRIIANQAWVQAMSGALGEIHQQTLRFADNSQIYTKLDTASEKVLDALAVNWKIDWYDTGYSIEQKRRIVKSALVVRRTMGTVGAVKSQADAIYPGSTLEEWFEWGGEPGLFRISVDVTTTDKNQWVQVLSLDEIERRLATAKRYTAHLDSVSYQVTHGLAVGVKVETWKSSPPRCGAKVCGTLPTVKTVGWSESENTALTGKADAFTATPDICGTIPQQATTGCSVVATTKSGANHADGYAIQPSRSGIETTGTKPEKATVGESIETILESGMEEPSKGFTDIPPRSGDHHCGTKI